MGFDSILSNDFEYCLRILKSRGITKGEVAQRMSLSSGHLSRMISGKEPMTRTNIDLFNNLFGNWVTFEPDDDSIVHDPEVAYKSLTYYQNLSADREKMVQDRDRTISSLNYTITLQKEKIEELERKLSGDSESAKAEE